MNRRHLLQSLPVLATFGSSSSILSADARSKSGPRLRTAICAYSFRDALKKKTGIRIEGIRKAGFFTITRSWRQAIAHDARAYLVATGFTCAPSGSEARRSLR